MAKKSDFESPSILRRLVLFLPAFYVIYFVIALIVLAGARVPLSAGAVFFTPFNWAQCNPAGDVRELVPFVALVVAFLAAGPVLVYFVVANTKQSWDFVATLVLVHLVTTCVASLSFPVNWVWWVAFLGTALLMSFAGELANYYLRDMREIQLDNE